MCYYRVTHGFSALQRAEIAEIADQVVVLVVLREVSVLFNEPKLLKSNLAIEVFAYLLGFSALQRAEIAEIQGGTTDRRNDRRFSALQRAEIAEIAKRLRKRAAMKQVSVLFNEPKLLKFKRRRAETAGRERFSALQRAEIAEIQKKTR